MMDIDYFEIVLIAIYLGFVGYSLFLIFKCDISEWYQKIFQILLVICVPVVGSVIVSMILGNHKPTYSGKYSEPSQNEIIDLKQGHGDGFSGGLD